MDAYLQSLNALLTLQCYPGVNSKPCSRGFVSYKTIRDAFSVWLDLKICPLTRGGVVQWFQEESGLTVTVRTVSHRLKCLTLFGQKSFNPCVDWFCNSLCIKDGRCNRYNPLGCCTVCSKYHYIVELIKNKQTKNINPTWPNSFLKSQELTDLTVS